MNTRKAFWSRTATLVGLAAVLEFTLGISVASAVTLVMPDRQALVGTPVVVWGNTDQANGTADSIDCGNGTMVPGPTVTDQSYIATTCTYAAAGMFNATLTVGAETATAVIDVRDPAVLSAFDLRAVKINMAIEDGLRFLYFNQNNRAATFNTNMTSWSTFGGVFTQAFTGMAVLGIENHGHVVNGPATDIFQPVVQRGLNSLFNIMIQQDMTPCNEGGAVPALNPCIGVATNPNIGLVVPGGDNGYATPIFAAAIAAAASVAPARTVGAGIGDATYVTGHAYSEILQRLTNAVSWGQGNGPLAFGWSYGLQAGNSSDGSTMGWAMLGLENAQAAGAMIPAEVRSRLTTTLAGQLNPDGSLSYQYHGVGVAGTGSMAKVGIGLQGLSFSGAAAGNPQVLAALGYISKNWINQVDPFDGFQCISGSPSHHNKGCGYAMFNNFKGLRLLGIQTLPGVGRAAGPGPIPANDWYADYVDNLLANQQNPTNPTGGDWNSPTMGFSSQIDDINAITALAELILAPTAFVAPSSLTLAGGGTNPLGVFTTVIATATTGAGAPAPGATVTFAILSGPDAGSITCNETGSNTNTTDAAGQARCTYKDTTVVGTDNVQASIGLLASNIVNIIWILAALGSLDIPTLSEWGMLMMAALLGLAGLWALRRRKDRIG